MYLEAGHKWGTSRIKQSMWLIEATATSAYNFLNHSYNLRYVLVIERYDTYRTYNSNLLYKNVLPPYTT